MVEIPPEDPTPVEIPEKSENSEDREVIRDDEITDGVGVRCLDVFADADADAEAGAETGAGAGANTNADADAASDIVNALEAEENAEVKGKKGDGRKAGAWVKGAAKP